MRRLYRDCPSAAPFSSSSYVLGASTKTASQNYVAPGMMSAVPQLYAGHAEEVDGIPDAEDQLWSWFEDGSKVLVKTEELDIVCDIFVGSSASSGRRSGKFLVIMARGGCASTKS